jgi:hypothetical protein
VGVVWVRSWLTALRRFMRTLYLVEASSPSLSSSSLTPQLICGCLLFAYGMECPFT